MWLYPVMLAGALPLSHPNKAAHTPISDTYKGNFPTSRSNPVLAPRHETFLRLTASLARDRAAPR